MSLPRPAYGSILVTIIVFALALCVGNAIGGVQASPANAPAAAPQRIIEHKTQSAIGEVSGTALPGDKVRVTRGKLLIGETVAGEDETWRVPVPQSSSTMAPFHVQILPSPARGTTVEEGPVNVLVSVGVGLSRVEVRVQVASPNGQVDIDVPAPFNVGCEN